MAKDDDVLVQHFRGMQLGNVCFFWCGEFLRKEDFFSGYLFLSNRDDWRKQMPASKIIYRVFQTSSNSRPIMF